MNAENDWSVPIPIIANPENSQRSSITVDSNGNVYVVWVDSESGDSHLSFYLKKSGDTHFVPINLEGGINCGPNSIVADSSGDVHLIFFQYGSPTLYYKKLHNGEWSPSEPVSTEMGANILGAAIAIDLSDTPYVVWASSTTGNDSSVYYSKRTGETINSWMSPVKLSDTSFAYDPRIAIDQSGIVHVVWVDLYKHVIYYQNSKLDSPSIPLSHHGYPAGWPDIVVDSLGKIHVVWHESHSIYHSFWNETSGWSSSVNVSNSPLDSALPSLEKGNDGKVYLVWQDIRSNWEILFSVWNGSSWSPTPINISRNDTYSEFPAIAFDHRNQLHVVWQEWNSNPFNWDIYYSSKVIEIPASPFPDYKQFYSPSSLWGDDPYAWYYDANGQKVLRGSTIEDLGCFITSVVDIMRYWGITTVGNGKDVNPGTINEYLSEGYKDINNNTITGYPNGVADWEAIRYYSDKRVFLSELVPAVGQTKDETINAQLAKNQPVMVGVPFFYERSNGILFTTTGLTYQNSLDQGMLSSGLRAEFATHNISLSPDSHILIKKITPDRWWINDTISIVNHQQGFKGYFAVRQENGALSIYSGNKNGHWVVIFEPKTNGHYPINDPGTSGTSLVNHLGKYGDTDGIGTMILVQPVSNGDQPAQRIVAKSPIELLVTDPLGRQTGFDPSTQSTLNEIPGARYVVVNTIVNHDTGLPLGEPQKVIYLPQPLIGKFNLAVAGTGNGPYELDFQSLDSQGNIASQSVTGTASEGSLEKYSYEYDGQIYNLRPRNKPPTLTLTMQETGQYSDFLTFDISATDPDITDTLVLNAYGLPTGLVFKDNEDRTGTISGVITVAPGQYPVQFTVTDSDNLSDAKAMVILVNPEDAKSTYIGPTLISTSSATVSSTTVRLQATIQDISVIDPVGDSSPGDITKTIVSFVNRDSANSVLCSATPILNDQTDYKTGTASCLWAPDIGASSGAVYTVGVIVSDYYSQNSSEEDTIIVVSTPTSNFITGGGYLINQASAGKYAGAPGTKTNFGLNVKFSKDLTNLQGRVNILLNQNERVYQIESNNISSLVAVPFETAKPLSGTAELLALATVEDITDPQNPILLETSVTLYIGIKDNGEPGNQDTLKISVWDKDGRWLFLSNWIGARTTPQVIDGGNLQVH